MSSEKIISVSSSFDDTENIFQVLFNNDNTLYIKNGIAIKGIVNGNAKSIDTSKSLDDYIFCCTINPYLNAQNDVFKINLKIGESIKSVGYVFPAAALEGDEEEQNEIFDEPRQAYKFYCVKHLIKSHHWTYDQLGQEFSISLLTRPECCYVIIFKPLLNNDFNLSAIYPSLALYGYYNFPENVKPNITNFLNFSNNKTELEDVLNGRFWYLRKQNSLTLKLSKKIILESPLVKLLYNQILVTADNPLYRFLLLYQIIEYLVDNHFRKGLNILISKKDDITPYKLVQEIHELNNTRSVINQLFSNAHFDEKNEITGILKSFISEFETGYNKESAGDCVYDIRNLLLHDYKSILNTNRDGALTGLIIQYEFMIHQLLISLSND